MEALVGMMFHLNCSAGQIIEWIENEIDFCRRYDFPYMFRDFSEALETLKAMASH